MRFFRSPAPVQFMLKKLEWRVPDQEKQLYLTFDDGPIPEVTEFVLEQLEAAQAQATFFCVGHNVTKYPKIAGKILEQGHRIGNHTYNHLKGWETPLNAYLENVEKCQNSIALLKKPEGADSEKQLFRPPYGKITRPQMKALLPQYRLIMWDVLTYDFDAELPPEACLRASIAGSRPGSIVVFHDSLKARRNLEFVLPRYLAHFREAGFRFKAL